MHKTRAFGDEVLAEWGRDDYGSDTCKMSYETVCRVGKISKDAAKSFRPVTVTGNADVSKV